MARSEALRAKQMFVDAQPSAEERLKGAARGTLALLELVRRNDDALFGSFFTGDAAVDRVDAAGVPALWVCAPGSSRDRVFVHFHGGGYIVGSAEGRRAVAADISRAGDCRVLVPDYRLAPEHPFPAAVDDALAAYKWALREVDPSSIVLGGDSAGGGLALATMLAARDQGIPLPAGAALLSPLTDFTTPGESWERNRELDPIVSREMFPELIQLYLNGRDPLDPLVSPVRADLHGLPPILILVGSEEALVDDVTRFAETAARAGCDVDLRVYEDMFHIWPLFASILPEGKQAIDAVGEFVRKVAQR